MHSRRTLALALVREGAWRKVVAGTGGINRQTLRDWVIRYNPEDSAGLCKRPHAGGPVRKLSAAQTAALTEWVHVGLDREEDKVMRQGPRDLQRRMAERFQVTMHEHGVGRVLVPFEFPSCFGATPPSKRS